MENRIYIFKGLHTHTHTNTQAHEPEGNKANGSGNREENNQPEEKQTIEYLYIENGCVYGAMCVCFVLFAPC